MDKVVYLGMKRRSKGGGIWDEIKTQTGNDWLRINVTGQDVSGALRTDMKEHGTPV